MVEKNREVSTKEVSGQSAGPCPKEQTYEPPRILSIEPLEVAAAVCDPPVGGFGKIGPPFCGVLGS